MDISGTIWTDFKPQMEQMNVDKLTLVAWDPPGYGKSRPPDRTFPDDFFQRDAAYAHNLMKTLGYSKFSLVGWSDGGITSFILASAYPDSVRKMVVSGANAYIHPDEIKIYESMTSSCSRCHRVREEVFPIIQFYVFTTTAYRNFVISRFFKRCQDLRKLWDSLNLLEFAEYR